MSTLLQEKARELLDQNEVSLVIGYGEFFRRTTDKSPQRIISPVFISKPDEAKSLIWNDHCVYNLSTYLIRKEVKAHRRIALVAKGCDVKSICVLIQENQIKRNNLVIIGLTCQGVVGNTPHGYAEKCYSCQLHTPNLYDILIPAQNRRSTGVTHAPERGEKRDCAGNCHEICQGSCHGSGQGNHEGNCQGSRDGSGHGNCQGSRDGSSHGNCHESCQGSGQGSNQRSHQGDCQGNCQGSRDGSSHGNCQGKIDQLDRMDQMDRVDMMDRMSSIERWLFWKAQFSRCIRCYACRNICPLCYCERCIADKSNPQWIEKGSLSGNLSFHIIRAFHLAGRCTNCGECERVCPMGIPLSLLTRKMAQVVKDLFQFEPGLSPGIKPFWGNLQCESEQSVIGEESFINGKWNNGKWNQGVWNNGGKR